jgi:hypothetical protein
MLRWPRPYPIRFHIRLSYYPAHIRLSRLSLSMDHKYGKKSMATDTPGPPLEVKPITPIIISPP